MQNNPQPPQLPRLPRVPYNEDYTERWLKYFLDQQSRFLALALPPTREISDPHFAERLPFPKEPRRIIPYTTISGLDRYNSRRDNQVSVYRPPEQRASFVYDLGFMLPDRPEIPAQIKVTQEYDHAELPPRPERTVENAVAAATSMKHEVVGSYPHIKANSVLFGGEGKSMLKRNWEALTDEEKKAAQRKRSKFDHPFTVEVLEEGAETEAAEINGRGKLNNFQIPKQPGIFNTESRVVWERKAGWHDWPVDEYGTKHPCAHRLREESRILYWPYIKSTEAWSWRQKRAFVRKMALATIQTMQQQKETVRSASDEDFVRDRYSEQNFQAYRRSFNKIWSAVEQAMINADSLPRGTQAAWHYLRLLKQLIYVGIKATVQEVDARRLPQTHRHALFDQLNELRGALFGTGSFNPDNEKQGNPVRDRLQGTMPQDVTPIQENPLPTDIPNYLFRRLRGEAASKALDEPTYLHHGNLRAGHNIHLSGTKIVSISGWHDAAYVPYAQVIGELLNTYHHSLREELPIYADPDERARIPSETNWIPYVDHYGMRGFSLGEHGRGFEYHADYELQEEQEEAEREGNADSRRNDPPPPQFFDFSEYGEITEEDVLYGDTYETPPDHYSSKPAGVVDVSGGRGDPNRTFPAFYNAWPRGDSGTAADWYEAPVAYLVAEYFEANVSGANKKTRYDKWSTADSKLTDAHNPGGFWHTPGEAVRSVDYAPPRDNRPLAPLNPEPTAYEVNAEHHSLHATRLAHDLPHNAAELAAAATPPAIAASLNHALSLEAWAATLISHVIRDERCLRLSTLLQAPGIWPLELARAHQAPPDNPWRRTVLHLNIFFHPADHDSPRAAEIAALAPEERMRAFSLRLRQLHMVEPAAGAENVIVLWYRVALFVYADVWPLLPLPGDARDLVDDVAVWREYEGFLGTLREARVQEEKREVREAAMREEEAAAARRYFEEQQEKKRVAAVRRERAEAGLPEETEAEMKAREEKERAALEEKRKEQERLRKLPPAERAQLMLKDMEKLLKEYADLVGGEAEA